MKKLSVVLLLVFIAAAGAFAQQKDTPERVKSDANQLLTAQEQKADAYHKFLDEEFLSMENRQKLNEYRKNFSAMDADIYRLKNRISIAQRSQNPNIDSIKSQRDELQGMVDDYDNLLSEFKQWINGLS